MGLIAVVVFFLAVSSIYCCQCKLGQTVKMSEVLFLFLMSYFKWQLQEVETLIHTNDPYKLMTERDGCVGVYPEH